MNDLSSATNDIVRQTLRCWADAFDRGDWAALTSLYAPDAQLFGGKPDLYAGTERVREYFTVLAPGATVTFDEPAVVQPLADAILVATIAKFSRAGVSLPHRLSLTLLRKDARWQIASHHASPKS